MNNFNLPQSFVRYKVTYIPNPKLARTVAISCDVAVDVMDVIPLFNAWRVDRFGIET